jgi:hypothetical protein
MSMLERLLWAMPAVWLFIWAVYGGPVWPALAGVFLYLGREIDCLAKRVEALEFEARQSRR